jgi:hypothetical protein
LLVTAVMHPALKHSIGPIEQFMVADHVRLDGVLAAATANGRIDHERYAWFRHDLLRHIAMEEKVLLPDARERNGAPLELAAKLRADHGAIAKLLVRSPTIAIIDELRILLARHNALEEGPDGLYATCDRLAAADAPAIVARLRVQPKVPVAPFYDGPFHHRS